VIGTNASRSMATSSDPPSVLPLLPSHLDGAANDHLHHASAWAAPQIMQRVTNSSVTQVPMITQEVRSGDAFDVDA